MTCQTCKTAVADDRDVCLECGSGTEAATTARAVAAELEADAASGTVAGPDEQGRRFIRPTTSCRECGAELRAGVRFCTTCGANRNTTTAAPAEQGPTPDSPSTQEAAAEPAAAEPAPPAAEQAPAAAPTVSWTAGASQTFMLPELCKLVWSPRKNWTIDTSLSDDEIARVFTAGMTKKAGLVRRLASNYYRRVSWTVNRHDVNDELVARCQPNGLVSVGWGERQRLVDVSSDTIECHIDRPSAGSRAKVSVGPGSYTTWTGLYLFPATNYSFSIARALKRADRASTVHYPWSVFRIVLLSAIAVALVASSASGGGGSSDPYSESGAPVEGSNAGAPVDDSSVSQSDDGTPQQPDVDDSGAETGSEPQKDETAPAPSSVATVPAEATNPAQKTVVRYWNDIKDGNYGEAYDLYTTRMANTRAGARSNWTDEEESQDIEDVSPKVGGGHLHGRTASIRIDVQTEDRHGCNRFRGTYTVRRVPGEGWRIDDQDLDKSSC